MDLLWTGDVDPILLLGAGTGALRTVTYDVWWRHLLGSAGVWPTAGFRKLSLTAGDLKAKRPDGLLRRTKKIRRPLRLPYVAHAN